MSMPDPSPPPSDPPAPQDPAPPADVASLQAELDAAKRELQGQKRRGLIERELAAAGALDAPAVAPMLERTLTSAGVPEEADVRSAVARLRSQRPALFRGARPQAARGAPPMGGVEPPPADPITDLAGRARRGDRGSLLAYLRARREK
jgi:hypothetical protein